MAVFMFIYCSCSIGFALPEACITIKVVNEEGKPIEGINVGLGFERNTGAGTKGIPINGLTNTNGSFTGKENTINFVGYRAYKEGYYESEGEYRFQGQSGGRWYPWNPEIKVVLRKIGNPVPMYARDAQMSPIALPALEKPIGFDLMEYDWVSPYGKGIHSDFIFELTKQYVSAQEYGGQLTLTFPNKFDGIQLVKEDRRFGSQLKLPRFAPEASYNKTLDIIVKKTHGKPVSYEFKDDNNYIFRIRSEEKNGKLIRAMYGKIHGDIKFDPKDMKISGIVFKYYLNPDYTKNLEFDPKQNLFKNLGITETVGLD